MIQWLSLAKTVLPHIADIVSAAGPVFTKRKSGDQPGDQASVLQQQINELQSAAAQNTSYIKELASQLETTISALEEGATAAELKLQRAYTLCYVASGIAITSLGLSLFAIFGR